MHAGAASATAWGSGTVTAGGSDGSVESRLTALETRFRLMEEHHATQIREVRATITTEVDAIRTKHREAREAADEQAQRETRFNLTGPAVLAIFGTTFEVLEAFA